MQQVNQAVSEMKKVARLKEFVSARPGGFVAQILGRELRL